MKKFEELERIKSEMAAIKALPIDKELPVEKEIPKRSNEQDCLSQEQLEELFKRTSAFTVKSVIESEDYFGEPEIYQLDGTFEDEDEYT